MRLRYLFIAILAALVVAALPVAASAGTTSTITVNTTNDNAPESGECDGNVSCSLRQAIDFANQHPGDDTIDFDLPEHSVISLTNGPLVVDSNDTGDLVDIEGPGADQLTIQRDPEADQSEVLDFGPGFGGARSASRAQRAPIELPGFSTLAGVTVAGGDSLPEQAAGINVYNRNLLLYGVAVLGNRADGLNDTGAVGGVLEADGTLVVVNSTVAGNSVPNTDGGSGGGIGAFGDVFVLSSTVAGNSVTGDTVEGSAGGIWVPQPDSQFQVINSTISQNSSDGDSAGGVLVGGPFSMGNSILAQNTGAAPDCISPGGQSRGYNVIGNFEGDPCNWAENTGDQIGDDAHPVDARLAPLADNGGGLETMALRSGSPAIDHGNPATPADNEPSTPPDPVQCPTTDERGVERPQRDVCDAGAFETRSPFAATTGGGFGLSSTTGGVTGSVVPGPFGATVRFQYGTTTAYGSFTPPQELGPGTSAVAQAANLSGLAPGTTYHFRIVAANIDGSTAGADHVFTTPVAGSATPEFANFDITSVTIGKNGQIVIPGFVVGCPAVGGPCNISALIESDGKVAGKIVAAKHKKHKARRHVFGHRTYGVPAGSITKVKVKLSKGTRRLLKRHGKLRAVAHINVVALGSGKHASANRKFKIRGKKKHKHKKHHSAKAAAHARTAELRRLGVLDFFASHRGSGRASFSPWRSGGSR